MYLHQFTLKEGETRLLVKSDSDQVLGPITREIRKARAQLIAHMEDHPDFRWSVEPLEEPGGNLPPFVSEMYKAGSLAGVGPFASVAGAMADVAARAAVDAGASDALVENGGDLCLHGDGPFVVALFAGSSPFSERVGFEVRPGDAFAGLCTSSALVGESVSFGDADAVAAYSLNSAMVADAAATSICNEVKGEDGLEKGLEKARRIGKVGVLVIQGERMGAWGDLPRLLELDPGQAELVLDPSLHSRA